MLRRSGTSARRLAGLLVVGLAVGACCVRLPEIALGRGDDAAAAVFGSGPSSIATVDAEVPPAARFTLRWRVGAAEERQVEVRLAAEPAAEAAEQDAHGLRIVASGGAFPGEAVLWIGAERWPSFEVLSGDDQDAARRQVVRYAMLFLDVARRTDGFWLDLRTAAREFVAARKAEIISNLFGALDLALAAAHAADDDVQMQRFLEATLEVDWAASASEPGRVRVPVRLGVGRVDLMRGGFECVAVDPADPASLGVRSFEGRVGDCQFRLDHLGAVADRPSAVRDVVDTAAVLGPDGRLRCVPGRLAGLGHVAEVHAGLALLRRIESPERREARLVPTAALWSTAGRVPDSTVVLHRDDLRCLAASRDGRLSVWSAVPRGAWREDAPSSLWRPVVVAHRDGRAVEVWQRDPTADGAAEVLVAADGDRFAVLERAAGDRMATRAAVFEVVDGRAEEVASFEAQAPRRGPDVAGWTGRGDFLVHLGSGEVLQWAPGRDGGFEVFERVGWDELPAGPALDVQVEGRILRLSAAARAFAERDAPPGEALHRPGDPLFVFLEQAADPGTGSASQTVHAIDLRTGTQESMALPPGTQWHPLAGWIVHHDTVTGRLRAMHRSMPQLGWQIDTTAAAFVPAMPLPVHGRRVGPWDPVAGPEAAALLAVHDLQPSEPRPMFGMHALGVTCRVEVWLPGGGGFAPFESPEPLRFGALVSRLDAAADVERAARDLVGGARFQVDPRGSLLVLDGAQEGVSGIQAIVQTRGGPVGVSLAGMFDLRAVGGGDPEWLVGSHRAVRLDAVRRYLAAAPGDEAWRADFLGWPEPPRVLVWRPVSPGAPGPR